MSDASHSSPQPGADLPDAGTLLAAFQGGVALLTREGEWRLANPAVCELLEAPADALLGTAAHRRLFPEHAAWIDQCLAAHADARATGEPLRIDYRTPTGARRHLHIDIAALDARDGREPLFLLQVDDGTPAHEARVVRDLAHRQQEHLAFGFSHDLRGSLRSIEGFAAQLARQPLDSDGAEHLQRIREAAAHAGRLVDSLVQLSRATTSDYDDAMVDLSLLVAWVVAELQDAEPGRAAEVAVQPGLAVRGDERYLRLMLQQLLHNAWKFSGARDRVRIEVDARDDAPGRLVLSIRDHGCGFDMQYADRILLPFKRLHGAEQGGGHGLGLAIADTVARRHGGQIRAEAVPDAGSVFFVELPAVSGSDA